ncbi:RNA-guided endonuclease InsQ/TnpB family protein [Coleofasciculus sp.]|uniref:RNA-guided endonuclease InsQ/TnpB family protein n=1 Tax=Coleofasciculus sp. TaxID=3100458 RepID=UPI0039F9DE11
MQTTNVYRLPFLSIEVFQRLQASQQESAKVWNTCKDLHRTCRVSHLEWLSLTDLQKHTKGKFELHSQSIQLVCRAFIGNIDSTKSNRQQGLKNIKYPWRDKKFYPAHWHGQAVKHQKGKTVLSMGKGRKPIVLPIEIDPYCTIAKLVWSRGFELHVSHNVEVSPQVKSDVTAAIDLGEIHLATVVTSSGEGLIVTGRGIRSLKRHRHKQLRQIVKKQSRCKKGSRRWQKLQRAKNKLLLRTERRIKDLRHKATTSVVSFLKAQGVSQVYIGNPDGVRRKNSGRKHNQRMAGWEYGTDIDYLTYKCKIAGIKASDGNERGSSSTCPECGHRHKPRSRNWKCPKCKFTDHRDLVGAVNIHHIGFGKKIVMPTRITYLRPGITRSSSSGDTRHSCLTLDLGSATCISGSSTEDRSTLSFG